MPRLIWSPSAIADIQRAYLFLFDKNPVAARQAVGAIRQSVNILAQHPEIGRPVEVMDPEYREWPIAFGNSGYIALYRYDGQTAIIVAIRHQREAGYFT
jgi:plasmid stabilization system protein ParE